MSKRNKNTNAQYKNFYAHIDLSDYKNPQKIKQACREMDEESYIAGRGDIEHDLEIIPFAEFAWGFSEFRIPPATLEALIKANYAAYLDGYYGKEFKNRTICE